MIARAFVLIAAGFALGITCAGCSSSNHANAQGQTHWLAACSENDDCGGLECLCGACVAPCEARGACEVEGVQTECFASGSGSVRAMCGADDAVALCLEPCEGACGDGQSCVAGACVNEELAEMNAEMNDAEAGRGGAAGSGTSRTDASGTGATNESGSGGDDPIDASIDASVTDNDAGGGMIVTPFALGFANTSDLQAVLQTHGLCGGGPTWFRLRVNGQLLNLFTGCTCDEADSNGRCPVPPPDCPASTYETVQPGSEFTFEWDGQYWPQHRDVGCSTPVSVARDTEIEMTVCWLDTVPSDPLVEPLPEDYHCGTRMFTPGTDNAFWMAAIAD